MSVRIHGSGTIMRYPLILGICLIFCFTASAASKKKNAVSPPVTVTTTENPPAPQGTKPETSQEKAGEPQPLPGVEPDKPVEANDAPKEQATPAVETAKPVEVKAVQEEKTAVKFKVHRVWLWQESRDCLWNIAKKYYGDPWQWKKIYIANKFQISDPRKIFPRQILIIPPIDEPEK